MGDDVTEVWTQAPVECARCGYEWRAVFPHDEDEPPLRIGYECPQCHETSGRRLGRDPTEVEE